MSRSASLAAAFLAVAATPAAAQEARDVHTRVVDIEVTVSSLDDSVRETETGPEVRFRLAADVLFAFDSARLDAGAMTRLDQVSARLRREEPARVRVVGYTDSKGTDAYNVRLSRRRAEAVHAALARELGSDAPAFEVRGRGEASPVAPNTKADGSDNPAGRARNRRVEIIFPRAG
jgi:outer membrane protein OmpA-like peptidoglycan-associated protein